MIQDFNSISSNKPYDKELNDKRKNNVDEMKQALLQCNDNPVSVNNALRNVTVLRVYHQLSRIIEYTELMDKLEDKLYTSINNKIDESDPYDDKTWVMLLNIQDKLQKNMIDSMKLIQPYLDLTQYTIVDEPFDDTSDIPKLDMDSNKREQLRNSAKSVLKELNVG